MAEPTTETPTTPTEGTTSSEAAATTLLSSTEPAATTQQQQGEQQQGSETPGETKPGEAKPAAEAAKTEETKPEGAPEKYEFKAPDGKEFDSAVLASFEAAARENNLTQDAAQTLLETMAPALAARQTEQVKAVQTGWADASRSDKEFGGDKLPENLAVAKKALDSFAPPEFRKLLDDTGLGNHPEVIRMLYRVGKGMSEDKFVVGAGGSAAPRDLASKLYPNTPSK